MNLLLLLSALLSALTGAGAGARRPEIAQAVSAQAVAKQPVRVAAQTLVQQPKAALPTLAQAAAFDRIAVPIPTSAVDLWANRRRE